MNSPIKFKIKEIADYYNITARTLRFYEEKGLIHPKVDAKTKYRYFAKAEIERLEIIVQLKAMGFCLDDIKDCLRGRFSCLDAIEKCKTDILKLNFKLKELEFLNTKPNKYELDIFKMPSRVTLSKEATAKSHSDLIRQFHDFIASVISKKVKLMPLKRYFIEHIEGKLLEGTLKLRFHANVDVQKNMPEGVGIFKGAKYLRTCHKGLWKDIPNAFNFMEDFAQKNGLSLSKKTLASHINGTFFTEDKNNLIQIFKQIK